MAQARTPGQRRGKNKPVFYLLAGPNGAGKTTLYQALVLAGVIPAEAEFVNADLYEAAHLQHIADAQARSKQAQRWADTRRAELLQAGTPFVSETVFSHESKLALIADAQAQGFFVMLLVVALDQPERLLERVAQRVAERAPHAHPGALPAHAGPSDPGRARGRRRHPLRLPGRHPRHAHRRRPVQEGLDAGADAAPARLGAAHPVGALKTLWALISQLNLLDPQVPQQSRDDTHRTLAG